MKHLHRILRQFMLATVIMLAGTSCTFYHAVTLPPAAQQAMPSAGVVYVVQPNGPINRAWIVHQPVQEAAGLRGTFFLLQPPRADIVSDLEAVDDDGWYMRMKGCRVLTAAPDWVAPLEDGGAGFLPAHSTLALTVIEKDRKKGARSVWIGIGALWAVVGAMYLMVALVVDGPVF